MPKLRLQLTRRYHTDIGDAILTVTVWLDDVEVTSLAWYETDLREGRFAGDVRYVVITRLRHRGHAYMASP